MTDLLKKPNNQRIPKKRQKNTRTCTTDEGRFGKKPWITLQAAAFTEQHVCRFLKVHGLNTWVRDRVHSEILNSSSV